MPDLSLRAVLSAAVIASLAAAQDAVQATPPGTLEEAWLTGRARMAALHAPGLVFVLPPADAPVTPELLAATKDWPHLRIGGDPVPPPVTARDGLLRLLQIWRQHGTVAQGTRPDLSMLFAFTVPMVLDAATCGAKPGETVLLLDPDGKVTGRFQFPLTDEKALWTALAPVLDEKAIAARRAAMAKNLLADVQSARQMRDINGSSEDQQKRFELGQQAMVRLGRSLQAAAPALVEFEDAPAFDEKGAARTVRRMVAAPELHLLLDGAPPLGTEVARQWDPCPPCGMAARSLAARSLLKLLPK